MSRFIAIPLPAIAVTILTVCGLGDDGPATKQKNGAAADQSQIKKDDRLSLLVQTLSKTNDSAIRKALMRGMLDGLAGRRNVVPPKEWAALRARLAGSDDQEIRDL